MGTDKLYPQTITARLTDRQYEAVLKLAKKEEMFPAAFLRELVKRAMRETAR